MNITKRVTLRLENDVIESLKVISTKNGCTVNQQINTYIADYVAEYEKKHGEIKLDETE